MLSFRSTFFYLTLTPSQKNYSLDQFIILYAINSLKNYHNELQI
jgi:hypothetical protein